ncbi:MAG TPA: hypothetical protein VLX29_11010 [Nitrospirota bacterium]|nr:hypothetical protein [Nitrospirota bacterium]
MKTIVSVNCLKHVYPDSTEIHMCGLDFVEEQKCGSRGSRSYRSGCAGFGTTHQECMNPKEYRRNKRGGIHNVAG